MTKWISVKNRLPENENYVLGTWYEYEEWGYEVVFYSNGNFDSQNDAGMFPPISHWMPLPDKPEDD